MWSGITELHPIKNISDHPRHRQWAHRFGNKTQIHKLFGVKMTDLILQLMGRHPPGEKLEVGGTSTDKQQQRHVWVGATTRTFRSPFMSSWLLTKACWESLPKKHACCGSCPAHWTDPVFFLLEAVLWLHRRTRKMFIPQGKKKVSTGLYVKKKIFSWPSEAETKLSLAEILASLVHLDTSQCFLIFSLPPPSHSPAV